MNKIKILVLFITIFLSKNLMAQWEIGPAGGLVFSDIVVENIRVATDYGIQPAFGIMGTYLPDRNRPGVKLLANRFEMGFHERTASGNIYYSNSGMNFQFLSYLYLPVNSFRISIELGPTITWLSNPSVTPDQSQSVLPEFREGNINKLMADLAGGIGLAQPIGKITISAHSLFSFSTTKIFKNQLGYSNPLTLQAWLGIQYRIGNSDHSTQ